MIAGILELQMRTDLARLVKDMDSAKRMVTSAVGSINKILGTIGVSLSVGYFVSLIKASINAADAMNDLHQKTGLAFKDLAAFKLLADQSGSSVEGVATAVKFLSKYMIEHGDKLKTIGVTSKDVNTAMRQFADTIKNIQDPALRTALAVEVLGKSGSEMIPTLIGGAAAFDKAAERTQRYAKALEEAAPQADEFKDTLAELTLESTTLWLYFNNAFLPVLNELAQQFNTASQESDGFKDAMGDLADAVVSAMNQLDNLVLIARLVGNAFYSVLQQTALLKLGLFEQAGQVGKEFEEYADGILMQYDRISRAAEKAKQALPDKRIYQQAARDDKFMGGGNPVLDAAARALINPDVGKALQKQKEDFDKFLADIQKATSTAQMNITDDERAKADMRIAIAMAEMAAKVDFAKLTAEQKMAYVQAFTDFSIAKTAEEMARLQQTMDSLAEKAAASLAPALDMNQQLSDSARGLADAYGQVGQSIGGMATSLAAYGETAAKIQADAKKAAKDNPAKEESIRIAATNKTMIAQVRLYGDLASSAKGFFKEKSTGYKVMETAEKTFRAIEFALSVKAMAQDLTETGASIINSGARAIADGIAGVAKAFGQMGVWGFVGAAAIIAFLAAIGVKMSGGGGVKLPSAEQRQESAGTGSVFGDASAKSESIANSIKILEENSFQDLEYTNAMLEALRSIQSNIEGLTNILIRQLGVPGGPGDTSGLGLGETVTSDKLATAALKAPYANYSIALRSTFDLFAKKVTRTLVDYGVIIDAQTLANIELLGVIGNAYQDVETKTSKFFGIIKKKRLDEILSPLDDEFANQLTMVILGIRDSVTEAGKVLGIAGEDMLKDFIVDIGAISLKGLTGAEIQDQFNAIFSKLGDDMAKAIFPAVTEFAKVGEGAMETLVRLARDYQIVDLVLKSIGQTFALVGLASIEARERLIELSGGIGDFIEQAAAFAATFLSDAERAAPVLNSVLEELARLGISGVYTLDAFKNLVLSLDLTTEEGAALYAALMKLAPAFATAVNAVHDAMQAYFNIILEAQQFQFEMQQRISSLGTGGGGAAGLIGMSQTLIAQYQNSTTTLKEKIGILNQLSGLVGQWVQQQMAGIAAQKEAIQEAANLRLNALNKELELAQKWVSVLSSAKQLLDSMKFTTTNPLPTSGRLNLASLEVARLQQQLASAKPEERAGISAKLLEALQKQLSLAQEFYQRPSPEYQAIYNKIIKQVTEIESEAQKNADEALRIQKEISALQEATVAQLKAIDAQIAAVNAQAIAWYQQIAAAGALVYEELRKQAEEELFTLADAAGQRDRMIDILAAIATKLGVPAPGFAGGLDYVPYDNFSARLHKGERVLTAQEARESDRGVSSINLPIEININGGNASDAQAIAAAVDKRIMQIIPVIKQKLKRA